MEPSILSGEYIRIIKIHNNYLFIIFFKKSLEFGPKFKIFLDAMHKLLFFNWTNTL